MLFTDIILSSEDISQYLWDLYFSPADGKGYNKNNTTETVEE